jgi:hypothetical protein
MSLLSDVQICNLALDAIATRSTITSLQENSKEAKACARHYPAALASCLGAAHWNFARAEVSLSLLKDASKTPPDVVPTPWVYEYAYPSDCLGGRYVKPLMQAIPGSVPGAQSLPYATGSAVKFLVSTDLDSQGNRVKVILTNQPAAQFVYTTLITDTSLMDESFITALWNYLAHLLARPLSGDKTLAKQCYEFAQATCNKAQADNGNEGLTVIDVMPDWMRVRGYTDDWQYPIGSYTLMAPQSLAAIS